MRTYTRFSDFLIFSLIFILTLITQYLEIQFLKNGAIKKSHLIELCKVRFITVFGFLQKVTNNFCSKKPIN